MSEFNPQFEKLGNILIHQKLITDDQLEAALSEQKTSKDKLGHVLIKQGSITENDLIEVYANQLGYRHILEDDLLKTSLFKIGKNNKIRDFFYKRLIFPIHNINSKVIGFGGRSLDGSDPKYINSSESDFFNN